MKLLRVVCIIVTVVLFNRHVIRFNSFMDHSTGNTQLESRNIFCAASQYADLAPLIFDNHELKVESDAPSFVKAAALAAAFDKLGSDLKLPMRLHDVGISDGDIPKLAAEAMKQTRLLPNNPREVKLDDAIDLYTRAL